MGLSLHGVTVPHRKKTAGKSAIRISAPKTVTIPTVMHIGKPATVIVKPGDHVDIGTLIAEHSGGLSINIHSSVSGKVSKITDILLSNGNTAPAIVIENDEQNTVDASIAAPTINSKGDFIEAIKNSGIVGLGGAGFPTYAKFELPEDVVIEELIINGAECEPYITSDTLTMIERADDMEFALGKITELFGIKKVIIGIEKNKPRAISSMKHMAAKSSVNIEVRALSSLYPQGGEKVLVYHTTGKVIGRGMLPRDVGVIVLNCTTVAEIGRYIKTGMPLVEKCITVDGGAVVSPQNLIVPVGTSMFDAFDFCGGFKKEPKKLLYGGPMMGIAVPSLDTPVLKQTNAILAFNEKQTMLPKTTTCIRCGNCVNHCPFGINPYAIANAFKNNDLEKVESLGVDLCMECGCCSYICPANRPLVHTNRLAKLALRKAKSENGGK